MAKTTVTINFKERTAKAIQNGQPLSGPDPLDPPITLSASQEDLLAFESPSDFDLTIQGPEGGRKVDQLFSDLAPFKDKKASKRSKGRVVDCGHVLKTAGPPAGQTERYKYTAKEIGGTGIIDPHIIIKT